MLVQTLSILFKINNFLLYKACFGGTALLSTKHSHLLKGVHRADSASWNPHKTLGAPLQCALFLVKEKVNSIDLHNS